MRPIGLIDTTLRDGQQSLWATRMTTDMLTPILAEIDAAGFDSIEFTSSVIMDAQVRYLKENPWERMRILRQHIRRTPLRALGMSQFYSISRVLPDDFVELFTKTCARAGIDQIWITASMNDVRTAEVGIKAAREAGCTAEGGVQFTISPVHTDEYFVRVTREFVEMGVDGIVIKDAGGLLTPERAKTLVPAMRHAAPGLPIRCHSHTTTGLGPASNLEVVKQGGDGFWTCSTPLANGGSLPADQSMVRALEWMGYDVNVDAERIAHIAEYFTGVARRHGKPLGQPAEYDPVYYEHQLPGGMRTNFEFQLEQLGMEERLDEVLEEMPRVRAELGWPNVQTPYSQFIGTQALLNVVYGRYEVVPDEVRKLVLGYWGRTPGEIDPDVLDKAGRGEEPVTERPGQLVEPMVERLRKEMGPYTTDEDLLLAGLYTPNTLEQVRQAQISGASAAGPTDGSIAALVREAAASPRTHSFYYVDRT